MLVRDVMTTDVVTASTDTSLAELIDLMVSRDLTGVPVVEGDRRVSAAPRMRAQGMTHCPAPMKAGRRA